jgi:N-acyl-D-aspartate/D-glutamate deacylase
MTYDIVIKNARIIDGTGSPWFMADIGIADGKIQNMGAIVAGDAKRSIDAAGKVACPGFIDLHNHSDITAPALPGCESNLMQGVTTAVVGNCGLSMAPASPETVGLLKEYLAPFLVKGFDYGWDWESLGQYNEKINRAQVAMNLAPLVGHGTLRIAAAGFKKEPLSEQETATMKQLLVQSLKDGAFGMSSGLIYPPGCFADTEELIRLGAILKQYGRIYTSHIRDEADQLIESVEEAIRIGEQNGIPVQISHHKAIGANNWGKVRITLEMIEKARARGVDVSCEAYPYIAGSTTITSILPIWVMEGGIEQMLDRLAQNESREKVLNEFEAKGNDIKSAGWDGIFIASCPPKPEYEGKSLEAIVKAKNRSDAPYVAFLDLLLETKGDSTVVKFFMDEADVRTVLSSPTAAVITDSWSTTPSAGGKPHPRSYGTFPRVLGKYVREEKLMSLETAVQKMTALPASKIGIFDRGVLKQGLWADIVVFDPEKISDQATFEAPHQYPVGIDYILVNGQVAVENGSQNPSRFGKVLCPTHNG